jgi:polysaccharide deacetylase 2 family uncharacterized protein YibQ
MPAHDLNNPLSSKARRASRTLPSIAPSLIALALLIAVLAAVWVAVVDDPDGGRSVAVAAIEEAAPAATGSLSDDAEYGEFSEPPAAADEDALALVVPPALAEGGSALPELIERSAFGPLPRISPNGMRPREAYARRASAAGAGTTRVVLVIGGLGLSQTGTQHAIETLPDDVTLAFAPYGASLQRWVDKARDEGHEVLLQIPLEPLGYPQENPGEHTLLVSADGQGGQQDLHWIMSRMTSYAGVMNYMGARFTSDERALVPFLGEVGERGLYYLDDGTSAASLAPVIGEALRVPVIMADLVVDRGRSPPEIERELAALEAIAVSRGVAVGTASAFPASVEAIARWAQDAEARGIVLVPASAALGR